MLGHALYYMRRWVLSWWCYRCRRELLGRGYCREHSR